MHAHTCCVLANWSGTNLQQTVRANSIHHSKRSFVTILAEWNTKIWEHPFLILRTRQLDLTCSSFFSYFNCTWFNFEINVIFRWRSGTYGEVYSAVDRSTGKNVAIKILESITDNLEEIEEEYLVLRDLSQHPNLPTFVGIFLRKGANFDDDQLWFVMEVSITW